MKTTKTLTSFLAPILLVLTLGCGDGGSDPVAGPVQNDQIVHVPFFILDAAGQTPADPSAPIYEARMNNPVVAPDGHQLTLAEFTTVTGSATASCTKEGTRAALTLHGLIPNATYSAWNLVFKTPGFDPTFANLTGLGALGTTDGVESVFHASSTGDGEIGATTPSGTLSVMGAIGACALTDEFEWHVVGSYHIDGQAHGGDPGPAGSAVEQFGFMFKR